MNSSLSDKTIDILKQKAKELRREIVQMLACAGSGHTGGSLSAADIVTALYFSVMNHNPADPKWAERDRFVLSKGHAAPVLYASLALSGYFEKGLLCTLRRLGSPLQGHPCSKKLPGVEISTGSLGQGLSIANGMALGLRLDGFGARVYCLLGDGETQEGQVWEAAMTASHYRLDNLCAVIDNNGLQIDGRCCDVMNIEPIVDKWQAFGWHVLDIDGHDMKAIVNAFHEASQVKGKPTMIVARTVKGKGVSLFEGKVEYHGIVPTQDELKIALRELS